jgi:nucleoside phosphorylase
LLDQGIAGQPVCLAEWSAPAGQAIAEALQPRRVQLVMGTALTTPGSQIIQEQQPGFENSVLEMETSAIARVAAQYAVPLLALRGISDNPQEPLPVDPATIMDENYHIQVGKLLLALIRRPSILFQGRRMQRNTAIAAENAAIAVIAALGKI